MSNFTTEDTENTELLRDKISRLSEAVIGAAIEVHRALGPGLLESTYQICLCHELAPRKIAFCREVSIAVDYRGVKLDCGYRADLIVEQYYSSN